jgi:hypothetical protein
VTSDTAGSIVVTTPSGSAGAVDVVVTTAGGTATDTGGFTYFVPAPTIVTVIPSMGSINTAIPVVIDGTNLSSPTSVTFGGVAGTVTGGNATSIDVTAPASATPETVDVVVTTAGGTATDSGGFTYFVPAPTITSVDPTSGPTAGGTSVTIDGTNLASASSVTFGGSPGTVTSDTAGSIVVTTPPGSAGAVDVAVTTAGGTATDPGAFTYVGPPPAPTITSVVPGSGPTAGGTSVTIDGTNLASASSVTFGGSPGTVTSDTAGSIVVTTPSGSAGAVDVAVTTAGGTATDPGAFTYLASNCDPPAFTSGNSATAVAGTAFSFSVTVCSTAVPAIKASHLPAGLHLVNNGNGTATIEGTPGLRDSGPDIATITATVKYQTRATQTFTLTVDNAPVFKSKAKDTVRTGTMFAYPVTTEYGYPVPTITTTSTLPGGVSLLDLGNGRATLGGTPDATAGGVYVITIAATNIVATVTQTFTLTVYQAPLFTSAASDTIAAGSAMAPFTVTDTSYPLPKLTASGLPTGVKLTDNKNLTGTIAGTPKATAAGTYTVTLRASGKSGSTTQTFTLTVS